MLSEFLLPPYIVKYCGNNPTTAQNDNPVIILTSAVVRLNAVNVTLETMARAANTGAWSSLLAAADTWRLWEANSTRGSLTHSLLCLVNTGCKDARLQLSPKTCENSLTSSKPPALLSKTSIRQPVNETASKSFHMGSAGSQDH